MRSFPQPRLMSTAISYPLELPVAVGAVLWTLSQLVFGGSSAAIDAALPPLFQALWLAYFGGGALLIVWALVSRTPERPFRAVSLERLGLYAGASASIFYALSVIHNSGFSAPGSIGYLAYGAGMLLRNCQLTEELKRAKL